MSKTKDFIVTINESRFGTPRENLVLDLYQSGVYIYDGTVIGTPIIDGEGNILKGVPQESVGDYKFSSIPFGQKYTVVISGLGVTTQIPEKLKDIDIGLPYNVTGSDIPYKNNTNVSIQTAFESLDATSQLPRISVLEDDVYTLKSDSTSLSVEIDLLEADILALQLDTTNLYSMIGGDTTSALVSRIELLETDTTALNVNVDIIQTDVNDLKTDTTSLNVEFDTLNNFLHSFTQDKVIVTDSDGTLTQSAITVTELESLDNITGNIQNQIDSIPDINLFDPNDGTVGQILKISTDGTVNILIPADEPNPASGVNYLFLRGKLSQHNSVESGKAFMGSIQVDTATGLRYSISVANYGGSNVTICDNIARATSSKISTGIYKLQCRTNSTVAFAGNLITDYNKFESFISPVYGKRRIEFDGEETYTDITDGTIVGYCVLDTKYAYDNFYYQTAQLIIKTFDENWVLSDNILDNGLILEIKAFDV